MTQSTPSRSVQNLIGFYTLVHKEIVRFLRIWVQTILPPVITTTLYFLIFGNLIGPRIGSMGGHSYMSFIVPGLIMMSVINSAYANVVSSFFSAKFQRQIEELLVSPMPNVLILAGYVGGGLLRGLFVGIVVTIVSLFFTDLHIQHVGMMLMVILLTAILFSLAGFVNAVFARKFDDISIIPTFILTPLTYLGGVFYSISLLPPFWQKVSLANPVLYMVNAFRYSCLGISDINISAAIGMIIIFTIMLAGLALNLLNRGVGIRK